MRRDDGDFSRKTNTSPLNMRPRISVGKSAQLVHGKHEFISRSVNLLFCNFFSCSSTEKSLIFCIFWILLILWCFEPFLNKQQPSMDENRHYANTYDTFSVYMQWFPYDQSITTFWCLPSFSFLIRKDINLFSMLKYIALQLLEIRNIDLYNTCIMQNINEDFFLINKTFLEKTNKITCKNKFKTDNKKEQINKMYFITIRRSSRKKKKEEKAGIKLKACQSPHIFNKNCSHFQYGTVRITCSRIHRNLVSL